METKYYRVIKENFLWDIGAIICGEYKFEVNNPIYSKHIDVESEERGKEYVTKEIIENSPDYFERVYAILIKGQTIYATKERAKSLLKKSEEKTLKDCNLK